MVPTPLAAVDVKAGKEFVELLRHPKATHRPAELRAAAWLYTESNEDWRLYLVTPLVDTRGELYANVVIVNEILNDPKRFSVLQRRVEVVGLHDRYAEWLHRMSPVIAKNERTLGFRLDTSTPDNGVWSAYIYLST